MIKNILIKMEAKMIKNKIMLLTPSDMVNWGSPRVLTTGAEDIILFGNPGKAEDYVFRFKLPKQFEIKPFILSSKCFLTVMEGEVLIGESDEFQIELTTLLPAKSFCCIPAHHPIYFISKEQVILQFHGLGPIDIKYINPKDDPRNL